MFTTRFRHAAIPSLLLVAATALAAPTHADSAVTWGKPLLVDPVLGPPTVVSCPSATFCVLGDAQGAVLTGSGRHWSAPTFVDRGHALTALSCPSVTYCAAFDDLGRTLTYDGSTWTEPKNVPGADGLVDLSCASTTYCLAVTNDSHVFAYDGSGWTDAGAIPDTSSTYTSVGCATGPLCAVGDQKGRVVTWNGDAWSAWHVVEPTRGKPADVACPSSSACFAVTGTAASRFRKDKWRDTEIPEGNLQALSCPSPTFCMALTNLKTELMYRNGAWILQEGRERGRDAAALACTTDTNCLFVSHGGEGWTWDGTRWGLETQIEQQALPFSALSCPTDGFCMLTDNHGPVMLLQDGTWTAPKRLDDVTYQPRLSCVSATLCFLMDYYSNPFYTWNGRHWSRQDNFPIFWGGVMSCSTSGACIAASDNRVAYYRRSIWVQIFDPPVLGEFASAAACAAPKSCMVAYENGEVYPFYGSKWGAGSVVDDGQWVDDLACPTSTLCMAVLQDGTVSQYDGSTWGAPTTVIPSGVVGVSCPAADFCAAISANGEESEFDGTSWSDPVVADPKGDDVLISCSSTAFCVVADTKGFVVTKR